MRQHDFESAVARATGESLRTIRRRGFNLVPTTGDSLGHGNRNLGGISANCPDHASTFTEDNWGEDSPI